MYTIDKVSELALFLRTDGTLHCSMQCRSCVLFELGPEHSPKSTYMNLTKDEDEKESEEKEEQ